MRPGSLRHVTGDDFLLGNLKFVLKGEKDKVFRIPIPKELITDSIQRSEYYKQYVEMAARKVQAKEGGMKKTAPKADKPVKPAPAKQSKPATAKQHKLKPIKEKSAKPTSLQKADKVTEEASTRPSAQPEDDASANIICDTPPPTDAETEDVSNKEDLDRKTAEINEGQAGSDPGKTLESRPPPKYARMEEDQAGPNLGLSHVALSGPDPEPMHDDFVTTISTSSLRDRFKELPEADMKEILYHRMFESGSYKSLLKYVALYEALEASMKRANRDEFLAKKDKCQKRHHDN
nr:E-beta-farnesene synthase [Tanacetum cinerariifolium]